MALAYLKTVHGVLSCIQVVLGLVALVAGYLVWNRETGDLYWLFFMGSMRLLSLVLVVLTGIWVLCSAILAQQLFVKDLMEQMGKAKLLLLHGGCALVALVAAVAESYYLGQAQEGSNYLPRLVTVTVCLWLLLLSFLAQFVFVFLQ